MRVELITLVLLASCAHAKPLPQELRDVILTCPADRDIRDAENALALAGYRIAARGAAFVQTDFRPAPVKIGRGVTHAGALRVTAVRTSSTTPIRLRFDGRSSMQVTAVVFVAPAVALAAPVGAGPGDFEIEPTDAQWRDDEVQESLQATRELVCGTRVDVAVPEPAKKKRP